MTTQHVADRLVELCKKWDYETAYAELYSPEIISTELDGGVTTGMEAVLAKSAKRGEMMEKYISGRCGEATVAWNIISVPMGFTCIYKGKTEESVEEEIAIYEVKEGKITREWFFYDTSGMKE